MRALLTGSGLFTHFNKRWISINSVYRQDLFRTADLGSDNRIPDETDIVIVGGGALGMSTACWLKLLSSENRSVTIVERDFTVCCSLFLII